MAKRPCGCGPKGRHLKTCALKKAGTTPAEKKTAKPRTGGGKRKKPRAPAEPAVSSNGHGTLDNAAKDAGEKFLGHLLRVRDSLDAKITSVKELLAVL